MKTKRFVTWLLILAMVTALCAVTVSAENGSYEPGSVPHTRQIDDLLVIGDSIPAGYGLFGQWDFPGRLNMSHGERVEGAYPWLVGDALQAKHVYNMARCAYRTTEVLRLIDPAFDEELARPENTMERFISDCIFYPSGITNVNDIPTAAASVAGYAAEPMQWAVGHDLIHGKPGNLLDPAGVSTRAEAAVMFRALDLNVLA